jgi:two-component system invasion response regulator UvrY
MQTVVLVDDHILLRNGLASLIVGFGGYKVLFEADNGQHFIKQLKPPTLPDIVLMDINMPLMNGFETSLWIKNNHPRIKILALSMFDDENSIIKMFKAGVKGYILKDCDPSELKAALRAIEIKGFYYSEMVTGTLIHSISSDTSEKEFKAKNTLNEREAEFVKLACTELTYKEIADKMFVSPRTVDGYRVDLFTRLNVKTRVGLAMYAIRNGMADL